jgi:hypothetical protein
VIAAQSGAEKQKEGAKPFSPAGDEVSAHRGDDDDLGEEILGHIGLHGL